MSATPWGEPYRETIFMFTAGRRDRIIAVVLAATVFTVLVSPLIDLDPTTLCNAGLLTACVVVAYRIPNLIAQAAPQREQIAFRPARTLTDINCSRLC